jgi:hypothetical protein
VIWKGGYLMKNKKYLCIGIISFLTGIIIGFFIAPIKQGIGNNSGNTNYYTGEKNEKSEEV